MRPIFSLWLKQEGKKVHNAPDGRDHSEYAQGDEFGEEGSLVLPA